MAKIDDLDLQILSELSEDASISVPKLSKKIKVNSSVVYSRIKRLVKRKLIERFTIVVNDQELGYQVKALAGLNMDSKQRDNVIDELFKIDGVREIAEVTGRFDMIVNVHASTLEELHNIVIGRVGKIEGIQNTETFVEMQRTEKDPDYSDQVY